MRDEELKKVEEEIKIIRSSMAEVQIKQKEEHEAVVS